mgnify:CR=1 FL=1
MRIILHIGTHKTGTTSIQDVLRASSDVLRRAGILFPEAGCPPGLSGQHMLAWSVLSSKHHKLPSPKPPVWEALWREIDTLRPRKVILSAEAFSRADASEVEVIRKKMEGKEVSVVCYLRDPAAYLKSAYKQQVKMGKCSDSFSSFVKDGVKDVDYKSLVDRWARVFGASNVHVRPFDEAIQRGLLSDFAQVAGIDESILVQETHSNVSPPDAVIQIVRYLNLLEQRLIPPDSWRPNGRGLIERIRRRLLRGETTARIIKAFSEKVGLGRIEVPEVDKQALHDTSNSSTAY